MEAGAPRVPVPGVLQGSLALEPSWATLDEAYAAYLDEHPDPAGGSLLAQTILTGPARRTLLPMIDVRPGADILDLGTGFGPVLLELAHLYPVRAVGIDSDEEVLDVATSIASSLGGWIRSGSSVSFRAGDVRRLACDSATFDVATARLLFQHLVEPRQAVAELWRVLRPGGTAFVFDVDDGFSVTYPPPSSDLDVLERAFAACQLGRGGDREVGRKLSTYFAEAGFRIASVQPIAQAQHLASEQGDASRLVTVARLRHVRDEIVERGLLSAEEFDRRLAAYEDEAPLPRFRAECQLVLIAEKPLT